jgi:hypothetical protein
MPLVPHLLPPSPMVSPLLPFLAIAHICIFVKALVMVDILEIFLNILKLFLAMERDFTKSLRRRMDGVSREK